MKVLVVALKSL